MRTLSFIVAHTDGANRRVGGRWGNEAVAKRGHWCTGKHHFTHKVHISALSCGGWKVEAGHTVFAHYTGTLENGELFDSSIGKPHRAKHGFYFDINKGQVIKGWDVVLKCPRVSILTCCIHSCVFGQGFGSMKVGEKAVLTLRGDYAYGPGGLVWCHGLTWWVI